MPISEAPAEKSVTVHKKESDKQTAILVSHPYYEIDKIRCTYYCWYFRLVNNWFVVHGHHILCQFLHG